MTSDLISHLEKEIENRKNDLQMQHKVCEKLKKDFMEINMLWLQSLVKKDLCEQELIKSKVKLAKYHGPQSVK